MNLPSDLKHLRAPRPDADAGIFWLCVVALLVCLLLPGCATSGFDYNWRQTRPASAKPWMYVTVDDPSATCRFLGLSAQKSYFACAVWAPANCQIILGPNAPLWIIEHEEKHCAGYSHD